MMKRIVGILVLIICASIVLAGCGGGGGLSSGPGLQEGSLKIQVSYPQDNNQGQVEPSPTPSPTFISYYLIDIFGLYSSESGSNSRMVTQSAEFDDRQESPLVPTTRIDYPDTTATINNIPVGGIRIEVTGYDPNNNPVSRGSNVATITSTDVPQVTITMTPIQSPTISPTTTPTITPTQTITPSPTVSPTITPTQTATPTPSPSPSPSPSPTATKYPTILTSVPIGTESSSHSSSNSTVSDDGSIVAFDSSQYLAYDHPANTMQVYTYTVATGTVTMVSRDAFGKPGNGNSYNGYISGDGKSVVFESLAPNMPGPGPRILPDIFLYEVDTGDIGVISTSQTGGISDGASSAPSVNYNGTMVVYHSKAHNLATANYNNPLIRQFNIFLSRVNRHGPGRPTTYTTELISSQFNASSPTEPNDQSKNPKISRNGNFIVYESYASDLTNSSGNGYSQIILCDMSKPMGARNMTISQIGGVLAQSNCQGATVSDDGNNVAFFTNASNFPGNPNKTDVWLYSFGQLILVSVPTGGVIGDSYHPSISGDGRYVAFDSTTTGFVPNDQNNCADCFVYDTVNKTYYLVSTDSDGNQAEHTSIGSTRPFISGNGDFVAFESAAKNLAPMPAGSGGQYWDQTIDTYLKKWK